MLIFRRIGNPGALGAMLLALVVREMMPGDGTTDWIILVIGALCAMVPIPINGILGALGHIGALMVWPIFALAYMASEKSAGAAVSEPVAWIMEFAIWILLLGGLLFMPLVWGMKREQSDD